MPDPYLYDGSDVLRNKLNLRDEKLLDFHERQITTQRARSGIPNGKFDLKHLKDIHHHLFQDIYEWAGQVRTVEISKGGSQFQFRQYIETGMADIHRRIVLSNYLRNLKRDEFAKQAGQIIGDVNYVHPFREGNGRTQLLYLKQLTEQAGHRLDITRIQPRAWLEASKAAHRADYTPMSACIEGALVKERSRQRQRDEDRSR